MQLSTSRNGAVHVIQVHGRLDHSHAAAFEEALLPQLAGCTAAGSPVVLDFASVSYISSVGLRVLMLAAKRVKTQQGRISVAALSPIVSEIFRVSHFDLVLQVFGDVETAVLAVGQ